MEHIARELRSKDKHEGNSEYNSKNNSFMNSNVSDCNTDSDNTYIIDSSNESPRRKNSIKDFELLRVLGKGSYGKVVLAKNIYTNKYYAIKVIDKYFLEKVSNF